MPDRKGRFRIRASMLGQASVCPGVMALENHALENEIETGSKFTGPGTIAHKWLEIRMEAGQEEADAYFDDVDAEPGLRHAVYEFWEWWQSTFIEPNVAAGDGTIYTEVALQWLEGAAYYGSGTADLVWISGGHAHVVDYKFYNDPSMLPPVHEDMQMYAYAVGAAHAFPEVSSVTVLRVQGYHRYADRMHLDAEMLELARDAVAEEAEKCYDGRDRFNVGAQCQGCFHRSRCDEYQGAGEHLETREMQPYEGGDFGSEAEVLRFLIAAPLIKERIDQGYQAARRFIEGRGGKHVADITSGKAWGPKASARDTIVDPAGCLSELASKTSPQDAFGAAKTSKSALEGVLKAREVPAKDRRAFIGRLRDLGYIEKREGDPRYEWRKLGDGKA